MSEDKHAVEQRWVYERLPSTRDKCWVRVEGSEGMGQLGVVTGLSCVPEDLAIHLVWLQNSMLERSARNVAVARGGPDGKRRQL